MLEVQVAFVLLGIGLAGVCPLVVMQSRLSKKIARGFNPQTANFGAAQVFSLVPAGNPWARKLGVAAAIRPGVVTPAPGGSIPGTPRYDVAIIAPVEKALNSEEVLVHVSVTKHVTTPP